ncbi:conserved hypothetical protein [Theileria orientalis strain Shintoku]|uniref:Tyrosinase copper-binding domain-containing protein n=1 Tax=Theileria orientalis strain Shintoku TaxID=869250 RepID=J4C973_THEOR|nr:conserved hypothetical protein [Theileria orientalis strain Shintoku]BAM42038.1 conserved hypothetical protein [Theileria orientalis strain Shintoku]|eukprot:XP_009692339.1 conserved hypothetical protein [Theileria orientalis strain Shintoku]
MPDDPMFFHFHNLQDDFIKYYQTTNKNRIDQVKLSRLSILYGASALYRRIQSIFQNQSPKGIVICAHLKHSKLHDFYVIAASLIYGYTIFHSNWHTETDETLAYKLRVTKCRLVIIDDELDSGWMIPDVKYIKISDVYTQSIYNKSISLCSYLSLVDSLGKERSDSRIQVMLASQTKRVSEIDMDDVAMISFTEGKQNKKPKARMITFRELYQQFKEIEALNLWNKDYILIVFLTNPTYDWLNCTILYYCLYRSNVYIYFMQRYTSTYWKILWEANEHAKNVYLQLGKQYKILNFLYPRQIEALFTLEEISNEWTLITDESPSLKNNDVLFNINLADSDEEKEVFEQHNVVNTKKLARTTSRISNYFFGKKGILNNFRTLRSHDSSKISKVLHELPTSAAPKMTSASQNIHLYIQKLHLKFTELISVLADYRVHIFLSGTQTDYNLVLNRFSDVFLVKMFSRLFKGKVPIVIYGTGEVTPIMSISSSALDNETFMEYCKMGANNIHNDKPSFGYYIGTPKYNSFKLRIVRSISPDNEQFMVKCDEGEPGFIVCDFVNRNAMIVDENIKDLFVNDTYIGLDDIGFYRKSPLDGQEHFFWIYTLNASLTKDLTFPYTLLIGTSKLLQKSICLRYGLNTAVVRVETVKVALPENKFKYVAVVELISSLKSEISQDIKFEFLKTCKAVGLFTNYIEPSEIRILSIPWTYKGSVNYTELNVRKPRIHFY